MDGNKQDNEQVLAGVDFEEEIEIEDLKSDRTPTIPTWSGYNSLLRTDEGTHLLTNILFPLIPAPASDFSGVYTAM